MRQLDQRGLTRRTKEDNATLCELGCDVNRQPQVPGAARYTSAVLRCVELQATPVGCGGSRDLHAWMGTGEGNDAHNDA